jgi:hypothetical protein
MDFVAGVSNDFNLSARLLFNFDYYIFDRQILAETEKTKLGHYRLKPYFSRTTKIFSPDRLARQPVWFLKNSAP